MLLKWNTRNLQLMTARILPEGIHRFGCSYRVNRAPPPSKVPPGDGVLLLKWLTPRWRVAKRLVATGDYHGTGSGSATQ